MVKNRLSKRNYPSEYLRYNKFAPTVCTPATWFEKLGASRCSDKWYGQFGGCIFSFVVLNVWAMRRVCEVVGIGAHHCSTSRTYIFMGTSSEVLNTEYIMIYYLIIELYKRSRLKRSRSVKKFASRRIIRRRLLGWFWLSEEPLTLAFSARRLLSLCTVMQHKFAF